MRRPSAAVLGFLIVLLAITIVLAQIRPDPPRADELASPGHPGWAVDVHNGCWVWNSNPQPGTTVAWSGTCALNGRAGGRGIVKWHWEDDRSKLARYDGEYLDGRRSGHGAYIDENGNSYEGEWRDDRRNGRGVLTNKKGERYDGEFRDGKVNGRGVMTLPDGTRYEGEFRDGKVTGRGIMTLADGSRYEGDFRDGKRNGRGLYTFADGDRYEGEVRDGRANGRGVATLHGDRYEGEWRDGCFREGSRRAALRSPSECP